MTNSQAFLSNYEQIGAAGTNPQSAIGTFWAHMSLLMNKQNRPDRNYRFLSEVISTADWFWRAVDQDGDVQNILVQRRRNREAANRFLQKILQRQRIAPRCVTTDRLRSDPSAIRTVLPDAQHDTRCYANSRVENSHQRTWRRERQMQRFKSVDHAQRFLSLHARVNNLFRYGRHLMQAKNHRLLRDRAFSMWSMVTRV